MLRSFDFVQNFPHRLFEPERGINAVGILRGGLQLFNQVQFSGGNAQNFCFLNLLLRDGNSCNCNIRLQIAGLFLRALFEAQRQLF